jgi:predicted helicase
MSTYAIKNFHSDLERLKHFGGTSKETAIRFAFQKLLDEYAKAKDLMLVPEVSIKNKAGKTVTPDGTLKDVLRLDHGYWESKDEEDDIDEEIKNKFAKGYPNDNIIFEDSQNAVLFQHGAEAMRVKLEDEEALDRLLTRFIGFERTEITDFRKAIDKFKEDIPKVTETLHDIIEKQDKTNPDFKKAASAFLEICKQSINPEIDREDIKEMMVQHILSADIFNTIFDEPHFHQENNIARELNKVIDTFFTGTTRKIVLARIQHYYQTINAAAAGIADHHEKQMFLKVVYENFYKAYNPKAADRLGIVYTPNEIVQFMIKTTDYLLHKHFGKTLADKNVEILDPATGTGTFICDIIDFLPKKKVEYKYKNELHANELAILPYYIANLNIEYTYKQKMAEYSEFENLCLVDTLDNTGFHWVGKQGELFGVSAENAQRIKKQNEKKISVIIGNPPYNAKQENYNFQNANRAYLEIDKRIKQTFIKQGTAQSQIVVYDMYTRFYRWAMDRLDENGIISFITNRSFIDGRAFDGFRKVVSSEFNHVYIIDLGGDIRANPKLSGSKHNVFGIQTGVAIMFLIKKQSLFTKEQRKEFEYLKKENPQLAEPKLEFKNKKFYSIEPTRIHYVRRPEFDTMKDKLIWLNESAIQKIEFETVSPDKNHNWINFGSDEWDGLLPLFNKDSKLGRDNNVLFKEFSLGIASHRDSWVYDFSKDDLVDKINFFIKTYNESIKYKEVIKKIAWDDDLIKLYKRAFKIRLDTSKIINSSFRPFIKKYLYLDEKIISRLYSWPNLYKNDKANIFISLRCVSSDNPLTALASDCISDLGYLKTGNGGTFSIGYYCYNSADEKIENITDWGLEQFVKHYGNNQITKEDIFRYTYSVLHHPSYRKKYELNLKREFPRIPLYENFKQWVKWGEQLMKLHLEFSTSRPFGLARKEAKNNPEPKAKLKALRENGVIVIDDNTELHGIPKAAWDYKIGSRSALEWILDQYKESKPKDPTIAEKFNTYKFADYKEEVIDLLKKVCTVSVETVKVINEMPK